MTEPAAVSALADPRHHTGRPCIEMGCNKPAGTAWTPIWCAEHDVERRTRITASLAALRDAGKEPDHD